MKSKIKFIFIITFCTQLSGFSIPAPPTNNQPNCWPPPCVPIDGGIMALAAAGIAYGFYKSRVLHKAPK
jgi:hypothetical protein